MIYIHEWRSFVELSVHPLDPVHFVTCTADSALVCDYTYRYKHLTYINKVPSPEIRLLLVVVVVFVAI